MKKLTEIFLVSLLALLFSSCGEDRSHEYYELTKENQWIYNTMLDVYLWNGSITQPLQARFFDKPSNFFAALLHNNDKASFFTDTVSAGDYGMRLSVMYDPLLLYPRAVYALVTYVEPNSPAAKAGIERGAWISSANGKSFTKNNYSVLESGTGLAAGTEYIDYDDEKGIYYWVKSDTIAIGQSQPYERANISLDTVYAVRDKKAGYIFCNSFNGDDFKGKCDNVFSRFSAEDVQAVIIDLRYNSGGAIENAAYMASSLVPAGLSGTPFAVLKNSDNEIDTTYCYSEPLFSIGDKKLYFLIGEGTKSVAELLAASVNGSRSMYDAYIIGKRSSGTNIIVESIDSPYGFKISPATAIACLPDGTPLQAEGIGPDYEVDELEQIERIYNIGNEQEFLLYNTLYHIANGYMPSDAPAK
ncbi:MAG: hypothetical protein IJY44_01680 [Bacteroidaceae bacterium]|nr:hypothetical protein [Bacteroidaceae bacterium]